MFPRNLFRYFPPTDICSLRRCIRELVGGVRGGGRRELLVLWFLMLLGMVTFCPSLVAFCLCESVCLMTILLIVLTSFALVLSCRNIKKS